MSFHLRPRAAICVVSSILASSIATLGHVPAHSDSTAPNPNAEFVSLGPEPTAALAALATTADYRHVALVGPNGSRMSAYLDGVPGNKYDQISTVPPVLSADGKHMAYYASKSGQWFVVVDSKEYGPYSSYSPFAQKISGVRPVLFQITPSWPIVFSPDSKHVAFITHDGNKTAVVEDGNVIPSDGQIGPDLLFSKHGDHLVFTERSSSSACVVLDGVAGPKYNSVYQPQFSDDGHHLEYTAQTSSGKLKVVYDGQEGPEFEGIGTNNEGSDVKLSSDGAHVAYTAIARGRGVEISYVVIDGKSIPNASRVWMTPDGKSIAYLSGPTQQDSSVKIVANGVAGSEYGSFVDLHFAPNGHVIYSMRVNQTGKLFVIDGDKESDAYDEADLTCLKFSADGKHMAYIASNNNQYFVVLDGKKLKDFAGIQRPPAYDTQTSEENALQLTPGNHIVYHGSVYGNFSLVDNDHVLGDDGMVGPDGLHSAVVKIANRGTGEAAARVTFNGQTGPAFIEISKMAFSPDSKHFAYVGVRSVPNGTGVEGGYFLVADGVQKGEYPEIADLEYSPDSLHLFHFTTSHLRGGGVAYMDEKRFATFNWLPGFFITWLDDHRTLQILGVGNDKLTYRARYFLPGKS